MSIQIQDAVLYGLMNFVPKSWYEHGAALIPEYFDGERREIFRAIAKLNRAGQESDIVLVAKALDGEAEQLAVSIAASMLGGYSSLKFHVEHLIKAYQTNRAKDIGASLMETGDAEWARGELLALDGPAGAAERDNDEAMSEFMGFMQSDSGGLSTGLKDLDRYLCGLEPSDMCVIAARPSMGKTSLMLNIAQRSRVPFGVFSLEMSREQLMSRLIASHGVDYGALRMRSKAPDGEWPKITHAMERINQGPKFWIDDRGGLSIGELEAGAYRMVRVQGAGLICVDYLQLVTCQSESRLQEVSEISRRLKALAKNLDIPVIVLSQMNRAVEKRGNPTPVMSDLRETGQIEQDADQIVFLHRPEVLQEGIRPGQADLIVAKNRGGEIGTVTVTWQGRYQRFMDFAPDPYPRGVGA